ncbi:MarR family winged helix-turn-helix transcriptional regulator [Azospirillum halopraeferens]|uniref:MarR family winged helix-turn-helix transcriptional regulator n=1 Tax=Azospirillum halopraeferens TaxID=34010 RepID=UPI000406F53C|nr:MarR family winged helix-turn-helix transcriptional regulator [Azospirillum halopraeferens]
MPSRRSETVGYLASFAGRLFIRALERRIQPHGLYPGQLPPLLCLWEREGISQAELCRLVQVEQPTMANTLNRMERDDLIRRLPDPRDRRRALVYLTDRARALEEPVMKATELVNALATDGLSGDEREEFRRLMDKLVENLERDSES